MCVCVRVRIRDDECRVASMIEFSRVIGQRVRLYGEGSLSNV